VAAYANVHHALEQMRVVSLAAIHGSPITDVEYGSIPSSSDPPRVLVIGPEHSGKTTLCKTLANYAINVNQGWVPIMVNLDTADVRDFNSSYDCRLISCREDGQHQGLCRRLLSYIPLAPLRRPMHSEEQPRLFLYTHSLMQLCHSCTGTDIRQWNVILCCSSGLFVIWERTSAIAGTMMRKDEHLV
jgi:energy-coupling factor transporter ATP-binding protein EcfA2